MRDALAEHDVKLAAFEGGRDLVLDNFDAGMLSEDILPVLNRCPGADVDTDRRVEFEGVSASGGLGGAEHSSPDFLAKLVDEDADGVGAGDCSCQLSHGL